LVSVFQFGQRKAADVISIKDSNLGYAESDKLFERPAHITPVSVDETMGSGLL